MQPTTPSIWLHDSNETASGKPGTLQSAERMHVKSVSHREQLDMSSLPDLPEISWLRGLGVAVTGPSLHSR